VLNGELGENLTDEDFQRLMHYCGNVKRLEVRDASEEFAGDYFTLSPPVSLATKFSSLETVILTGCSGVDGGHIVQLMKAMGMPDRPKSERLRRLHLAGCEVDGSDIKTLSECVRIDRRENFVKCEKSPDEDHDGFDLWACSNCEAVMGISEALMCVSCVDTFCRASVDNNWGKCCECCNKFMCDKSPCIVSLRWYECDLCDETFCEDCESSGEIGVCKGNDLNEGCFTAPCAGCQDVSYYHCSDCGGCWCNYCFFSGENGQECCEDRGGCDGIRCGACAETAKVEYFICEGCSEHWCSECDHVGTQKKDEYFCPCCDEHWCYKCEPEKQNPVVCAACGISWCDACDPGVRIDLVDGTGSEHDACCPTCEVRVLIFS
jgi:hypothetical protein